MKTVQPQHSQQLESLVDEYGVARVLDMLANVCTVKALHIGDKWHDKPLADAWHTKASLIGDFITDHEEQLGTEGVDHD